MSGSATFDALAVGSDIQRRIGVKTSRDEPLARFTTMRVGGPADLFAVAHNLFELRGLVRYTRARSIPLFLLGRGSDLVIADAGIRGLVVQVRAEATKVDGERFHADAGVPMARAATESQKAGLGGLEYGLAIPGTAGGSVWANAGAHDSDTAGVLESATVVLADGTEREIPVAELGFTYRHSRFKDAAALADGDPGEVVLSTTLGAPPGGPGRDPRPTRRDPPLAPGAPAAGPAVGGLGVPQPAGRLGRTPDRRARAQGSPHRRRGRVGEAR